MVTEYAREEGLANAVYPILDKATGADEIVAQIRQRLIARTKAEASRMAGNEQASRRDVILPEAGRLRPVGEEFDRLINELTCDSEGLYDLSPRRFEELIAEIWHRMGYQVELTPLTRDGGRDVIATRIAETRSQVLIECKKYAATEAVGIDIVQRMLGVVAQFDATQGVITTTSRFTREALKVISAKPFVLTGHEFDDVVNLLWRVKLIVVPEAGLWLPFRHRSNCAQPR
jgi:HJR/Mrr/RecB family endonuclease